MPCICFHVFARVRCAHVTRYHIAPMSTVEQLPRYPSSSFLLAWNLRLYRRQRSIINPGAIKPQLRRNFLFQRANEVEKRARRHGPIFSPAQMYVIVKEIYPPSPFATMHRNLFCSYSGDLKIFMPNSTRLAPPLRNKKSATLSFCTRKTFMWMTI